MEGFTTPFDLGGFWTWFLLFTRLSGVFLVLPGVGTDEIPLPFRATFTMVLSGVLVAAGAQAVLPQHAPEAALMIVTEFFLGYLLGAIPSFIVSSLAIAGQVTAASIGLAQASLIDVSLGEHVSVLARVQALLATVVFLLIDGHHVVLRAAATISKDIGIGVFRPDDSTASLLLERFGASFELAVIIAGPVLVTILLTQFVLGLLTKFVPQVNVFIVSLPLTIFLGLFITGFTMPALIDHMTAEYRGIEEAAFLILTGR